MDFRSVEYRNRAGEVVKLLCLAFWDLRKLKFPFVLDEMGFEGLQLEMLDKKDPVQNLFKIDGIKYLIIEKGCHLNDFKEIESISTLIELKIGLYGRGMNGMYFSHNSLESLSVTQGYLNLNCPTLRKLYLEVPVDLSDMKLPPKLEQLTLVFMKPNMSFSPYSESVASLNIGGDKLTLLDGLSRFPNVKKLFLSAPRVKDYEELAQLEKLDKIVLWEAGELCKLENLKKLRSLLPNMVITITPNINHGEKPIGQYIKKMEGRNPYDWMVLWDEGECDFDAEQFVKKELQRFRKTLWQKLVEYSEFDQLVHSYIDILEDIFDAEDVRHLKNKAAQRIWMELDLKRVAFYQKESEIYIKLDCAALEPWQYVLSVTADLEGNVKDMEVCS